MSFIIKQTGRNRIQISLYLPPLFSSNLVRLDEVNQSVFLVYNLVLHLLLLSVKLDSCHFIRSIYSCFPSITTSNLILWLWLLSSRFSFTLCTSWTTHYFIATAVVSMSCFLASVLHDSMNALTVASIYVASMSAPAWVHSFSFPTTNDSVPLPVMLFPFVRAAISSSSLRQFGCPMKAILPSLLIKAQYGICLTPKYYDTLHTSLLTL